VQDLKKTTESKFISNYLGPVEYAAALTMQGDLLLQVQNSGRHHILGLEHPSVITLGYRANPEIEVLPGNQIRIEKIARGGYATIHSEGQLVIYPVVNLRTLGMGVRDYIYLLLETTGKILSRHGITSFINDEALGLYTSRGKIAFCGIQVRHGVTQHGISININNDLSLFNSIRSCGSSSSQFDRLADYAGEVSLSELFSEWVHEFTGSKPVQS
jgi:lipoyl(octanoyl) transferase